MKIILVIEPYYGGSHRVFLDELSAHSPCVFTFLTLPARKWKMRMQLAAPYFSEQLVALLKKGERYDLIFCSSFLDVAVFSSLLGREGIRLPIFTYFHENQFIYPEKSSTRSWQFAAINFSTVITSDRVAFNSNFNRETCLGGIQKYLKKSADMKVDFLVERAKEKSCTLYPGIDFDELDNVASCPKHDDPVIIWNHRWEHDKNPEEFFGALFVLADQGIRFKCIILGQDFNKHPAIFEKAKRRLGDRILHFGYVKDKKEYYFWLKQGTILASTAKHEFFGIAVLEGVRAGCIPLVPDRLSYPEIFPEIYRYKRGEFKESLRDCLGKATRLNLEQRRKLTQKYSWKNQATKYSSWFDSLPLTAF